MCRSVAYGFNMPTLWNVLMSPRVLPYVIITLSIVVLSIYLVVRLVTHAVGFLVKRRVGKENERSRRDLGMRGVPPASPTQEP